MAAPICRDIRISLETMRDAMVDLLFVRVRFVIRLADTFCHHFRIAFFMTSVFAICALHSSSVFQEVSTKSATHNIVKLLSDKLVALLFMDLLFLLAHGTLSIKTDIERSSILKLFGYRDVNCPEMVQKWIQMKYNILPKLIVR